MKSLVWTALLLGSLVATAAAQPTTSPTSPPPQPQPPPASSAPTNGPRQALGTTLPQVGELLAVNGAPGWPPKLQWLYDVPSFIDSTGKVVIHWFCAPKVPSCADDLARVLTLKENSNRVYVIAYINGTKAQAKKLDPIRESEGVGRGTLAFGRNVGAIMKKMSITGPASIVVDVDGKIAHVSTGSSPTELDVRDAKVNALAAAIKEYAMTSEGPKLVRINEKFSLAIQVKLASWLKYSKKTPMSFKLMAPKDIKCDATSLTGAQLKPVDQTLTAKVTCSGPRGIYEVRGQLTFGYDTLGGGAGLGTESANWRFEIK